MLFETHVITLINYMIRRYYNCASLIDLLIFNSDVFAKPYKIIIIRLKCCLILN